MSETQIVVIASITLSLLFSYLPGLSTWYSPKSPTFKRMIMLILLIMVSVVAFGLTCAGWGPQFNLTLECNQSDAIALIQTFVIAAIANQTTFLLSP